MDLDPVDDFTHTADSDEVIVMVTLQFKPVRQIEVLAEMVPSLEISRGCGLDRRNEWRKVLLAWDDTRC